MRFLGEVSLGPSNVEEIFGAKVEFEEAKVKQQPGPLYDAMEDLLSNEVARVLKPHSSASMAWNVPKNRSLADRIRIKALGLLQKQTLLSRIDDQR